MPRPRKTSGAFTLDLSAELTAELAALTAHHARTTGGTSCDADTVRRLIHDAYTATQPPPPPTTPPDLSRTSCYTLGTHALAQLHDLASRYATPGTPLSASEILRRLIHEATTLPTQPAPTNPKPGKTTGAVYRFSPDTRAKLQALCRKHPTRISATEALRRLVHAAHAATRTRRKTH